MSHRPTTMRMRATESTLFATAFFAMAVIVGSFWIHTGLDMYPLNDDWVTYAVRAPTFDLIQFIFFNSRELRVVPILFAKAVEPDGFRTINAILIAIDALTFLGLFYLSRLLGGGRNIPAFVVAGLTLLFPNDNTMFWLGAFGVNLSYVLLIWSTVLACVAIDRERPILQIPALVLLYCGIRTYPGYIFLPILIVNYVLYKKGGLSGYRRGFFRYALPQLVTLVVAFAPTLSGLLRGTGREGHVASFNIALALDGYRSMVSNLSFAWVKDIWPIPAWMTPFAIWFAVLFSITIGILHLLPGNNDDKKYLSASGHDYITLAALCLAIVVLCYLPYAVSDLRFNNGRALMASRFGWVLLMVTTAECIGVLKIPRVPSLLLSVVAVTILTLFSLNKMTIFHERYQNSLYQRVFLADVADKLPCPPLDIPFVFVTSQNEFAENRGGKMLINRPAYLLRTLYDNDRIRAYTVSNYLLGRFGVFDPINHTAIYRGHDLGPQPLLLRYSFAKGVQYVRHQRIKIGKQHLAVRLAGAPLPKLKCQPTPLMQALSGKRALYLQRLKLARGSAK